MMKDTITNSFMRRQMVLSSIVGPIQKRIHSNDGEYVMDADWDNLLILDGCRYGLFYVRGGKEQFVAHQPFIQSNPLPLLA